MIDYSSYLINTLTRISEYIDVNISFIRSMSKLPLCRFKHNYHTTILTTPYIQMQTKLSYDHEQRRPLFRCKQNYHTITNNDDLYSDVNTTIIRSSSQRPLYRCKHYYHVRIVETNIYRCKQNYQTITVNDASMQT
jgi:hypothetical protein